jgi:hypothetical protein
MGYIIHPVIEVMGVSNPVDLLIDYHPTNMGYPSSDHGTLRVSISPMTNPMIFHLKPHMYCIYRELHEDFTHTFSDIYIIYPQ